MTETANESGDRAAQVRAICARFSNDRHRMLDILLQVQERFRHVSEADMDAIAQATGITRIEVEGTASFYAFLSREPKGEITIRLCDDIVDRFSGLAEVQAVFETALGIAVGTTRADGRFSIDHTPCIGLCDQAPAAMINDVVVTALTPAKARAICTQLLAGGDPEALYTASTPYDRAREMVSNNIRVAGSGLLGEVESEAGLRKGVAMAPGQIVDEIERSGLRGYGGAGFTSGRKWRLAATAEAEKRFVFCNADEGEPGTFKDRVLLTERPHLVFEGMTLAARAIGAQQGLMYLRGEYAYLRPWLEQVLHDRRESKRLGRSILGKDGFDFDIRIQLGAGSYVCGEEGALISSCEGLPGEPKTRPPFPVERGYLGYPTLVNNVETFAQAARIIAQGSNQFRAIGTPDSPGTKLFSVSGDVSSPGIFELPYGLSVEELLTLAGGHEAAAVLVGGPSGEMIGRDAFHRRLCFEDLATGGAVVVFSKRRNLLEIVDYYMAFFVEESCGYCTPCRVGNVFLKKAVEKFRNGLADASDIDYLRSLSQTIASTSRCGLGMTSPNPVLSTLKNFPLVYATLTHDAGEGMQATFDIQGAIDGARHIAKRRSYIFDRDYSR